MTHVEHLHIMPGQRCNLKCSHCCSTSSPTQKNSLAREEIETLKLTIRTHLPKILAFSGGEPTLYRSVINELVNSHPKKSQLEVRITTNGWFVKRSDSNDFLKDTFKKVDRLLLSWDHFHSSRLDLKDVLRLEQICHRLKIDFSISISISTPSDLIRAKQLINTVSSPVIFQKIEAAGRAKITRTAFRYPVFDQNVLDKKCENLGTLTYIQGKGFSTCCSNIAFNGDSKFAFCSTPEAYMKSSFYQTISNNTIGQLWSKRSSQPKWENFPELSSICKSCELFFQKDSS